MKYLTYIFIILSVAFINTSNVSASINVDYNFNGNHYNFELPDNISYLEYCYNSNQCLVKDKYIPIIEANILLIKLGLEPLWK